MRYDRARVSLDRHATYIVAAFIAGAAREHIPTNDWVARSPSERTYTREVATVEQPDEPRVQVYPPDEALRRARPLPRREAFVIDEVPDDEWTAFQEALAET